MAFVAIKIERMDAVREWDGRLARQLWSGRDGRDARPTLLPAAYFHRNPSGRGESNAISGAGH